MWPMVEELGGGIVVGSLMVFVEDLYSLLFTLDIGDVFL